MFGLALSVASIVRALEEHSIVDSQDGRMPAKSEGKPPQLSRECGDAGITTPSPGYQVRRVVRRAAVTCTRVTHAAFRFPWAISTASVALTTISSPTLILS